MPVYRANFPGHEETLLLRADSAAQAKDQVLTLKAMTSDEMADALAAGEKIYLPGDPILQPLPSEEEKLQAEADRKARRGGAAKAEPLGEAVEE